MQEAVKSVQVNKGSIVGDVFNYTLTRIPGLDVVQEFTTFLLALFFDELAAGDNDVATVRIDLYNFEIVSL